MILRDLLAVRALRLRALTSDDGLLDRRVRWVFATELFEPGRYLTGGELVVSGLVWRSGPEDSDPFVRALVEAGASGLAAGTAHFGCVPDDVVAACERHGLALLEVPVEVSFAAVTEHALTTLTAARSARLADSLGRHRRLLSAVAEGRGIDELTRGVAQATGVVCRVLTPLGTHVVPGPAPLADEDTTRVVAAFLGADRLPALADAVGRTAYSVLPVGPALGQRLTSWFVVAEGRWPDWDHEVRETLEDLAALAALDRARRSGVLQAGRPIADELLALVEAGAAGAPEGIARLRQAGLEPGRPLVVVVAGFPGHPELGEAASHLLDDLSAQLGSPVVVSSRRSLATAVLAGEGPEVTEAGRVAFARLGPGLRVHRLGIGIGAAPHSGMLSGALDSARHAFQSAALDPARVSVVSSDEITSYARLLATVPDEVRRAFAARVLGVVVDYDRAHDAGLVDTLRAFLAHSGSWIRTAEAMHLHVNTVRYRIARVEELCGRDLGRLEDRVDLLLALHSI